MVSQYGIKLAVQLISSNFGNLVSRVCECLLRRGTLKLQEIIQFTELSRQKVKECLLVLIQHNCVQGFSLEQEGAFGEASKISVHYAVLFDNIIHRMRFPKFLVIVSEELGKECEEIFEGILQHGRLTLEQILDRTNLKRNETRERHLSLVNAYFVERCPDSMPFLALPTEEEALAKKRGSKFAKVYEPETLEQRALAAAAPMETKRFLVVTDSESDANMGNGVEYPPSTTVGKKRTHDAMEVDGELGASQFEKSVLWRVNFEEFVRRLRDKVCTANVRSRMDNGTAIVLNAMLEASKGAEQKPKTGCLVPLSLNSIYEEVMKCEVGRTMTLDHVRASLGQLGCSKRGVDEMYSIDLKSIIEQSQNDEVESLVLKRYGRDAYRIFRLLVSNRFVETNKISDTAFVEKKDTTRILYKLWKDGYIHMEKVVSGVRKLSLFLWSVDKENLWKHFLDEMYHAALNLIQRVAYELENENEIIVVPKEKRVGTIASRYKRLQNARVLLESSLMMLDDAIMLFHDFC